MNGIYNRETENIISIAKVFGLIYFGAGFISCICSHLFFDGLLSENWFDKTTNGIFNIPNIPGKFIFIFFEQKIIAYIIFQILFFSTYILSVNAIGELFLTFGDGKR